MFKKVETKEEYRLFRMIWEEVRCEKDYQEDAPMAPGATCYLISNQKEDEKGQLATPEEGFKWIGTMEMVPYQPEVYTAVESEFEPYENYFKIKEVPHRTYEIDKLCLKKEYRSKGYMNHFTHVFYDHASTHQAKYYTAITERTFYRTLRKEFQLPLEQVGEAFRYSKHTFVPMLFDAEHILRQPLKYKWCEAVLNKLHA